MIRLHYHSLLMSPELGGAGLIAFNLASYIQARGEKSRVWLPGPGPAWSEAERLGLSIGQFAARPALAASAFRTALLNWSLRQKLCHFRPGLIHIHVPTIFGSLRHGLKYSGLKHVVHVHLEEKETGLRWAFKSPPDLIITCARFLKDQVQRVLPEHLRDRQRIAVVPNAVNMAHFCPGDKLEAKRKVGAPVETSLALMLANLASHKGQETAIRAAARLKDRGRPLHLWLAGTERDQSGAFTNRLRQLIVELGVGDRVALLGQRSDAADLLRAADFFLLPSTCEGLPLSILEAQATKVPVIAAPTAGVPEVVTDEKTGFLVAAEDSQGYARRIDDLFENPELQHRITEAAYVQVQSSHRWSVYCEKIWELYQELMRNQNPMEARQPVSARPSRSVGQPVS